ncbi:MAG: aldo/keto reductase [Opitutaceae bacterium]|nr:aldo/keto reductase [Opitutaceae bacterium]
MSRPTYRPDLTVPPELAARGLGRGRLVLGLAGLGGAWKPVDMGESVATVLHALEHGIDAFDPAPAYGTAEQVLARALAQWRGPRPIVSTKVGRLPAKDAHEAGFDHTAEGIRDSLKRSLDILGLDCVDLVYLHEPEYVDLAERPRVVGILRQLQADGLTRHLGMAGGYGDGWDGFLETGAFDVVMLFRRLDPVTFDGLAADVPRLRRAGALVYGASPLHMGLLGSRHDEFVRDRPNWVWTPQIERALRLKAVAARHGLPLRELAHRFMFALGEIDRTVIGASNLAELKTALADFAAGPLPRDVFEAVCDAYEG